MIITLYINAKPAETWNYLPMDHVYTITITNIRKNAKFLNKYKGVIIAIPPFSTTSLSKYFPEKTFNLVFCTLSYFEKILRK